MMKMINALTELGMYSLLLCISIVVGLAASYFAVEVWCKRMPASAGILFCIACSFWWMGVMYCVLIWTNVRSIRGLTPLYPNQTEIVALVIGSSMAIISVIVARFVQPPPNNS